MAKHKLNPAEGEVWLHPLTRNEYRIHSVTDDGWVRYSSASFSGADFYYTQPTLDFISKYERQHNG